MSGDAEWSLLDRYFSGECSAEEAESIVRWAERDAGHSQTLESARRVWAATGAASVRARFDTGAAWESVRPQLAVPAELSTSAELPVPSALDIPRAPSRRPGLRLTNTAPRSGTRRLFAPAAAVLAAAAALFVWIGPSLDSSAEPAQQYRTLAGQRSTIELSDGTHVMLNARSRLDVPAGYGRTTREVELEGEAFFEVNHDEDRPFLVHAGGAVAEDLGTEFVVRAYPEDSSLIVVVASGIVALRPDTDDASRGVALSVGQLGRLDRTGLVTVANDVDLDRYLAWRNGTLAFRQTPFSEVVRELERWYSVEITYDDSSLSAVPITASLTDLPAETALNILAQLLDVSYVREGSRVRLTPNGGSP